MIADKISNIYRYTGIHENIIKALEAIKEYAAKPELEDGVYEVVPGEIILHVITKETHKRCDAKMEMHKNFMDIHYMIDGEESCFLSELPSLDEIEYDPETDNGFWDSADRGSVSIREKEFYAVWPLEPHCPLCSAGDKEKKIRKIIAKVKLTGRSLTC